MNQGSNSWMILSKRITENNLTQNPTAHARPRIINVSKPLLLVTFINELLPFALEKVENIALAMLTPSRDAL